MTTKTILEYIENFKNERKRGEVTKDDQSHVEKVKKEFLRGQEVRLQPRYILLK